MNRREMMAALVGLPAAMTVIPARGVLGKEVKIVEACGSCVSPQHFRCAIDLFGEDCEVTGHPAQRNAWEMARLLLGNPAYSHEWNERSCDYFLGKKFSVDSEMPKDVIEFSRHGDVVGIIRNLAIPWGMDR